MDTRSILFTSSLLILIFGLAILKPLQNEITKRFVSSLSNRQVTVLLLFSIFIIAIIPSAIGINLPTNEEPVPQKEEEKDLRPKSDLEVGKEIVEKTFQGGKEIYDIAHADKQKTDSVYEANRDERWVYKIGDWMNVNDDEAILRLYNVLKPLNKICLFKDKRSVVFFKNVQLSKEELTNSENEFKSVIGNVARVEKIDLMSYSNNRKHKLESKFLKFGKRKEKQEIECYSISR